MADVTGTIDTVKRRIVVTRHAVERARHRYSSPMLKSSDIQRDVEAAIAEGREGIKQPRQIEGRRSKRARRENVRYAWTAGMERCYTIKRVRDERNGHEPVIVVLTAVQGAG